MARRLSASLCRLPGYFGEEVTRKETQIQRVMDPETTKPAVAGKLHAGFIDNFH
jgi:hypothetical protein